MNSNKNLGKVGSFNVVTQNIDLSSHSGLVMFKEFVDKLRILQLIDNEIEVKKRNRGYSESESIMAIVYSLIIGGEHMTDLDVLRGDPGTLQLLGVESIIAPTTTGEFLRKFTMGDIHDFHRVLRMIADNMRPHQTSDTCTIDIDSSIYEQSSKLKEGSDKTYKGEYGYHPLMAFWSEEEELLYTHLRRGSSNPISSLDWFFDQTLKSVPKGKQLKLRADSAFYKLKFLDRLESLKITYAITARKSKGMLKSIKAIAESSWKKYSDMPTSFVAELKFTPHRQKQRRYIVKRVQSQDEQGKLCWDYYVMVTNDHRSSPKKLMKWALKRCGAENLIKELKSKAGFASEKLPTQKYHANYVWLLIAQLAFNLVAWFKKAILPEQYSHSRVKTIRHHLFNLAGRIVESGRQKYLVLSDHYFFKDVWTFAIKQLNAFAT